MDSRATRLRLRMDRGRPAPSPPVIRHRSSSTNQEPTLTSTRNIRGCMGSCWLWPPLVAGTFSSHSGGTPIGDVVNRVRTTMPQSSPNSLTAQGYLDIVAYILQANGAPAGAQELSADS